MNDDQWLKLEDEAWDRSAPWELNGSDSVTATVFVDWHALFANEATEEEWIAWPVIPAQRQISIYAPAKVGKSLLILDIACSVASGRPILGQPNKAGKRHVLYLDYEMTEDDLLARVEEMGYQADDLECLHYALLPDIPTLNTPEGGTHVRELAASVNAEWVIIDTISRAVDGEENDSRPILDFYRFTGLGLKADKRALTRIDHTGKDISRGQRGNSAKEGDVDVIWLLARSETGLKLKRTHTRVPWVPEEVDITIHNDPLAHKTGARGYAPGTSAAVAQLDALGFDGYVSFRAARAALKAAGHAVSSATLKDVCRMRRERDGLDALVGGAGTHQKQRGAVGGAVSREEVGSSKAERLAATPLTSEEQLAERYGAVKESLGQTGSHTLVGAVDQTGLPGLADPGLSEIAAFFEDDN